MYLLNELLWWSHLNMGTPLKDTIAMAQQHWPKLLVNQSIQTVLPLRCWYCSRRNVRFLNWPYGLLLTEL